MAAHNIFTQDPSKAIHGSTFVHEDKHYAVIACACDSKLCGNRIVVDTVQILGLDLEAMPAPFSVSMIKALFPEAINQELTDQLRAYNAGLTNEQVDAYKQAKDELEKLIDELYKAIEKMDEVSKKAIQTIKLDGLPDEVQTQLKENAGVFVAAPAIIKAFLIGFANGDVPPGIIESAWEVALMEEQSADDDDDDDGLDIFAILGIDLSSQDD